MNELEKSSKNNLGMNPEITSEVVTIIKKKNKDGSEKNEIEIVPSKSGAVAGAAAGGVVAGPVGATVGAVIGGIIGGIFGSVKK